MHHLTKNPGAWFLLSCVFGLGVILMAISLWNVPYREGRSALQSGMLSESLVALELSEKRFNGLEPAKQLYPDVYESALAGQFYVLYQLGEYGALLDKSASSPLLFPVHFWSGCALFRRAGQATEVADRIMWLERAATEFLDALKLAPENWDAKYNYELSMHLIEELREKEETPPQIIELLRPRPRRGEEPLRQTG